MTWKSGGSSEAASFADGMKLFRLEKTVQAPGGTYPRWWRGRRTSLLANTSEKAAAVPLPRWALSRPQPPGWRRGEAGCHCTQFTGNICSVCRSRLKREQNGWLYKEQDKKNHAENTTFLLSKQSRWIVGWRHPLLARVT